MKFLGSAQPWPTTARQFDRDTHEMTAQRHASQSLREAADGATAQLQQTDSLALVGQVAMGVAHEVGGPLAIALGYLERLNVLQKKALRRRSNSAVSIRLMRPYSGFQRS